MIAPTAPQHVPGSTRFAPPSPAPVTPSPAAASAPPPRWRDAEPLLRELRGVRAVRIELDAAGDLAAVHVVSTADVAPKQTVRDVQTTLSAHFNAVVDHRKISVAPTGHTTPGSMPAIAERPAPAQRSTPAAGTPIVGAAHAAIYLDAVDVTRADDAVRCRLLLRSAESTIERSATVAVAGGSSATGLAREAAELEAGARAALDALAATVRPGISITFAGCVAVEAFGRRFAMASVSARGGREAASLTGLDELVATHTGAAEAAAGAALDAAVQWLTAGARLR